MFSNPFICNLFIVYNAQIMQVIVILSIILKNVSDQLLNLQFPFKIPNIFSTHIMVED